MPDTPETLVLKFYSVIACEFAAKGLLSFSIYSRKIYILKTQVDVTGDSTSFTITYEREKQHGIVTVQHNDEKEGLMIKGDIENQCIQKYMSCFSEEAKTIGNNNFFIKFKYYYKIQTNTVLQI